MSNDVEFTINPSTVLADLKANSNSRKQRSLDIIYQILEGQSEETRPDYSIASIGKLSHSSGGPSEQSIRNKGGSDYRRLIEAWAESKGTNTKKPSISKSRLPNKAEDLLRRIEDPALRAIVGTIIAERNRFMAENRLLKAQCNITIDCRSEEISTVSDKARNPLESLLSVTEIEALRYAASPKLLEDNGWTTSKTGRLKDGNGKTIMKVGFTSAIAKLVDKIDSADAILQG
ncbi:gamma-mobile-trio protein GmtX [Alkalimarinus alittae]|uniref:Gamma-mobile-trio protein GmtX n=1 Tax=Alkalimarinus alittae TaxID=2961619 RepID=A0ABY6N096_9ALTE|nr:gamma-mobile-trio protein GmtX [Alkalimarinus alittae]UZE95437.1 gamma-mobile-trio protein GmtX [Alkalimarinus alittae]